MKRYGSMEKSVIYVSILAFIGVVVLMVCLGMAAASDDSIVANVETETEKIGITLNTKDGLVLDTTLNTKKTLSRLNVNTMLTNRKLHKDDTDATNNIPDIISVNLPNVTTIGTTAFQACGSLTSVNLPNTTNIETSAFQTCGSLTSVNLPNTTTIGDDVFINCHSLTSVNLPNVTGIGTRAFQACGSLTSVNLPNTATIGTSAFQNCFNLTSINLPKVNSISAGAFFSCSNLTTVKFPTNVKLNGTADLEVFSGCMRLGEGLQTLTVKSDSSHVVDSSTGVSQGRSHATYSTGVITFG